MKGGDFCIVYLSAYLHIWLYNYNIFFDQYMTAIIYIYTQMGKKNVQYGCTEPVRSRWRAAAVWNVQCIAIFHDLCIKEVEGESGCHPDTHFSKLWWESHVANFREVATKEYWAISGMHSKPNGKGEKYELGRKLI